MIKILLGGSPCTKWSVAQSNNRETKPKGVGWELFKNYVIAKERFKPDYFLYENNMSADDRIKKQIEKELHHKIQPINSNLLSAQNRYRFYVHNIPNVKAPKDKGIILTDILEQSDKDITCGQKAYTLISSYNKTKYNRTLEENQSEIMPIRVGYIGNNGQANRVYSTNGKSICLSANGGGGGSKTGLYAINVGEYKAVQKAIPILEKKYGYIPQMFNPYNELEIINKAPTLTTSGFTGTSGVAIFQKTDIPIYVVKNGIITINGNQYPSRLDDGYYIIRRLSVIETKRLQTVPDDYIMPCSSSQNYKMLGNGWTVDIIAHILSHIPNISNEEIIVLSMYDGMSCGHIALDKLGANVKKYFATEIDKYCIETTQANYPNTIQLGDAMYVRTELFWNRLNALMPQERPEAHSGI